MAFLFACSCGDHFPAADLLLKWSMGGSIQFGQSPVNIVTGRTGFGIQSTGTCISKNIVMSGSTAITGWAHYMYLLPLSEAQILQTWDLTANASNNGSTQIQLNAAPDGSIKVYRGRGSTLLGSTAPGILTAATWHYIELKVLYSTAATGTVDLHVDGVSVLSLTLVQTAVAGARNSISTVTYFCRSGTTNSSAVIDDVYINDASGTDNTDFEGDVKVLVLFPNAEGRVHDFTVFGAATDWQATNEYAEDGDATYIEDDVIGTVNMMGLQPLPAGVASVKAVQTCQCIRKSDVGVKSFAAKLGDGVSEVAGATQYLGNSYTYMLTEFGINPVTGLPWAVADIANLEAGLTVIS